MKDWEYIEVQFLDGTNIRIHQMEYARMIAVAALMEDMEKLKNIAKVFWEEKKK